ncbi:alkaline phosphatase-like isoform X2 [Mercenaria mercenaria]|nr:alkaline phosphatase-like isoform X2 [Mercenaria mercenaria]XP_045193349.2 alkaline phosphatase-like isoform X2 [Mercenaria mercenaria]
MLLQLYAWGLVASFAHSQDAIYWRNLAKDNINRYLNRKPNTEKARNIVLMIGDGMGISTISAARLLKGQMQGKPGEETELNFEQFPNTALSKVYTTDYQVPDSAATMTAMVTGVKSKSRTIGVDSSAVYDECHDLTNHTLSTILHWSQEAGKSTGFVTTSRVTHATPAALYAATTNRDWENDHEIPNSPEGHCTDIASQLIYNASDIQVMMGGGARNFIPNSIPDPTTGKIDFKGQRYDRQNLIKAWKEDKEKRNLTYKVVHNTEHLQGVDPENTDYLFGLFHKSHMSYELDRDTSMAGEPSLAEMTRKAIQILDKNENGFFLMVEGARIDHGHHAIKAKRALTETISFERAVQTVLDMTNETETLVIVTADHSHTMTIAGYSERGNDILDVVKASNGSVELAEDDMPYTTLSYANGPNNNFYSRRRNLSYFDTTDKDFKQDVVVELPWETHSGEDVAVYSRGPMAHLLTGVKEQNVIAYVMAHAACVGDIGIPCETGRERPFSHYNNCDINLDASNQNSNVASLHVPKNILIAFAVLGYHILHIFVIPV